MKTWCRQINALKIIIRRKTKPIYVTLGSFPGSSSAGKESACNAGDPSFTPGLGSSPAEGIGYPLEYSWVSLVAQMAKNQPAMPEIWVQFLVWEDPLEKEMATHSNILAWRIPWTEEPSGLHIVHGVAKSQKWNWLQNDWATKHSTACNIRGNWVKGVWEFSVLSLPKNLKLFWNQKVFIKQW